MAFTLSPRQRWGYGIGDAGFNLYFTTASLYLLYYYTDVLSLAPATAGWIFAAALVWDAVTDPLMGYLASRTRSRFGRYRPWILFGAVPLGLSWVLIFLPTGLQGTALVLAALVAHMFFRTLYTIVSMPYLALSAAMTRSSEERGLLASARMLSATAAGLLIAFFSLELARWLGAGNDMQGFFRLALLYGTLGAGLHLFVWRSTREDISVDQPLPGFADMWRMISCNGPFWMVGGMVLMASMGSTFFGKSVPYLFKYDLERPDLIGPALATITAVAMLTIPLWTMAMRRTSKRRVALLGITIGAVAYLLILLTAPKSPAALWPLLVLLGAATGASILSFWAMLPDTVEYGEWKSGVRAEGMSFGLVSFLQKAALGLGVGLLGEALARIGYEANRAQTPETLADLRRLMTLGPVLFGLCAAASLAWYPLDGRLHGRMVKILARRKPAQV